MSVSMECEEIKAFDFLSFGVDGYVFISEQSIFH